MIEEYNNDNRINLNEIDKNKDEILNELINGLLPNNYLINLNNKVKDPQIKINKEINENKEIDYKDNIEIIDDKVKNLMIDLFGIIYVEERKIIFRNQKIIMDYKMENNLLIGDLEDYTFIPEIMINFGLKKPIEYYLSMLQSKGYFGIINELKKNNNAFIRNENEIIKVKVYNINVHKNNQFSSIINYNNEKNEDSNFYSNDNINGNLNDNLNIINDIPKPLLNQQNELGNDLEGNFFSDKEEVMKNELDYKNESKIIERQKNKSISTEGFREYFNKTHKQKELLLFTQNDIRALILYYFFF